MSKTEIIQKHFTGERALFGARDLKIVDTVFHEGESPLKEAKNIDLEGVLFQWKYPLWYAENITYKNGTIYDMGRAGIWYTKHLTMENILVEAPKNLRRCEDVTLKNVSFPDAAETLWNCKNVTMDNVLAKGTYFAMNMENATINNMTLYGDYGFDGAKNIEIHNSRMLTKDAFWNCDNITVYDSFISGEYFGWNSKNITLVNCTIESLQGFCYLENVKLINCKLINTTLAFEYATVEAEITNSIDSVFNPKSGTITAEHIGTLIVEKDKVDPSKTKIVLKEEPDEVLDKPEWK